MSDNPHYDKPILTWVENANCGCERCYPEGVDDFLLKDPDGRIYAHVE